MLWLLQKNSSKFDSVHNIRNRVKLQGRPGGLVVYQYTRKKFTKIPQNTQNSSKYTQIITRYTLYLKFKESDIPNTRI